LEFLPNPPTAEKALKVAVREAAVGQPDRLIRLGKEGEAEIVFPILAQAGFDGARLQRAMRHRDFKMTARYVHTNVEDLREMGCLPAALGLELEDSPSGGAVPSRVRAACYTFATQSGERRKGRAGLPEELPGKPDPCTGAP
jgi:hypothetical protein